MVKGTNISFIVEHSIQRGRWLADAPITRGMQEIGRIPDPVNVSTNTFTVLIRSAILSGISTTKISRER